MDKLTGWDIGDERELVQASGTRQERGQGQCLDVWRAPKWPIMVILWVNNDNLVNIMRVSQ